MLISTLSPGECSGVVAGYVPGIWLDLSLMLVAGVVIKKEGHDI